MSLFSRLTLQQQGLAERLITAELDRFCGCDGCVDWATKQDEYVAAFGTAAPEGLRCGCGSRAVYGEGGPHATYCDLFQGGGA